MHDANSPPLVTIGIPTFNRPKFLHRALKSVAQQSYKNIEVIVSDNGTPNQANHPIIKEFRPRLKNLLFFYRESNVGPSINFDFLTRIANGQYFMFLADDDEISPLYVERLVDVLDSTPGASTACGLWCLSVPGRPERIIGTARSFPQSSRLARTASFIWNSDDASFYGLHRLDRLQAADVYETTTHPYWRPNQDMIVFKAYFVVLKCVLQGQVMALNDPLVVWKNHYDSPRTPPVLQAKSFASHATRNLLLRLNVYWRYWQILWNQRAFLIALVTIPVSVVAIAREVASALIRRLDEN